MLVLEILSLISSLVQNIDTILLRLYISNHDLHRIRIHLGFLEILSSSFFDKLEILSWKIMISIFRDSLMPPLVKHC